MAFPDENLRSAQEVIDTVVSQLPNNLPFVSILIVNYNGKNFLSPCFTSLQKLNYPQEKLEVLLVDNNSTDGSVEFVRKKFPWVRIIEMDRNYGLMPAINRSVQYTKGDVFVILNNDTVVDENWLAELVRGAYSNEKVGICGSKVLFADRPSIIQFAGGYLHTLGGVLSPYYAQENRLYQTVGSTGYVIGCSMLIKKDVFDLIEGFDDDYFMYGEEGDLCWRTWLYGYSVMYNPDSIIYHVSGGSRKDKLVTGGEYEIKRGYLGARLVSETNVYHGNKNAVFTMLKNLEIKNIPPALIFSFFYVLVQSFFLLKNRQGKFVLLLAKALWWPIVNLRSIWKKRVKVQGKRIISDDVLFKRNLMLPLRQLLKFILSSQRTIKF